MHCGSPGANGGSGVVIIQYPGPQRAAGGTVSCVSCKTQHVFNGSGAFSTRGTTGLTTEFLLVAGGGGGGSCNNGGGGGAGGLLESKCNPAVSTLTLFAGTSYAVTVGAGGSGVPSATYASGKGTNSTIAGAVAEGGGAGGQKCSSNTGGDGGSGGGAKGEGQAFGGRANSGGKGFPGGQSVAAPNFGSGGGGGAGARGADGCGNTGGAGGVGVAVAIFGSAPQAPSYGTPGPSPGRFFAGGGGGGTESGPGGAGGAGGGGAAGSPGAGTAGTTNTGGGGGGAGRGPSGGGDFNAGNGGPGIVVLRVPTSGKPGSFAVAPGTNTTFTDGSCTVAVFTVTGTLTL